MPRAEGTKERVGSRLLEREGVGIAPQERGAPRAQLPAVPPWGGLREFARALSRM